MDKNKELSRLLDEVQKNESRVIQDRYNEKQRFENTLNVIPLFIKGSLNQTTN